MGHLVVRNQAQKVLFEEELKGQISDGMWENARPHDHWKAWCDAKVSVAQPGHEHLIGRNFYAMKDNYNFASKDLLDAVGDHMIEAVVKDQVERGEAFPGYGWSDLRADLADLKKIVRIHRDRTMAEADEDQREHVLREATRQAAREKLEKQSKELSELSEELGLRRMYFPTYGDAAYVTRQAHALVTALMARTDELEAANLRNHLAKA